jgi:uncharacterized protein (TIGR03435 family)
MQTIFRKLTLGLALTAIAAFAQNKLAFEVATVKPSPPLDMAKMMASMQAGQMPKIGAHIDADRAEYTFLDLKSLLALAYKVKPYQITGPDWMGNTRFDINAKLPDGASKDDAPQMLQALLAERFKLVAHLSSAEHPVLALVVGKGGPKLKESTETPVAIDESAPLAPGQMTMQGPDGPMRMTVGKDGSAVVDMGAKGKIAYRVDPTTMTMHMDASLMTMSGFADMLTQFSQMGGGGAAGPQIVDMTGLKGNYQATIDFSLADLIAMMRARGMDIPGGPGAGGQAPAAAAAIDPDGKSSLLEAVQSIGLKLESRKAMVEQLIVYHIEKTPTEN